MLYIISGDKYSYEPFFEEETLNGKIFKSRLRPPIENVKNDEKLKEDLKKSAKISFFNHEVRHWPIVFYSISHGLFYVLFMLKNYKPIILITVFKNNFLTIIYVILSLWLVETITPKCLIFLIKIFSRLSFTSQYKSINI